MPTLRSRRIVSRVAIAALFLLPVVVLVGLARLRQERAQHLAIEIRAKGGQAFLPPSVFENVRSWWSDDFWQNSDTFVALQSAELDGVWLRNHDFLADLSISNLQVFGVDPSDVALLVEVHAVKRFSAPMYEGVDSLVPVLAAETELAELKLSSSDLTDSGFRALPLEQLQSLDIEGAKVTPEGLDELRRCRQLEWLTLDGIQFDEAVARTLTSVVSLDRLELIGPDVTDQHCRLLPQLNHVSEVVFYGHSVTPAGLSELRSQMPNCRITVDE